MAPGNKKSPKKEIVLEIVVTCHDDLFSNHGPKIYCLTSHIDLRDIIRISFLKVIFPDSIERIEFYFYFFLLIFYGCSEVVPCHMNAIIERHYLDLEFKIFQKSNI